MKVFVTKYALTLGIQEKEGEISKQSPTMFSGKGLWDCYHGEGKDWHRTREGAVARAEQMRVQKITSLKKSIAKMEALKFT